MNKFYICKLSLIVLGVLLAVQNVTAQTAANLSYIEFQCKEVDRISINPEGQMQPAYPGRSVSLKIGNDSVIANGIFYGTAYEIRRLENGDLRGSSHAENRDEVFYISDGFLFHTAIVTNRDSKVIQAQVLSCIEGER
jgi:hypothetical protein